MNYQIPITQTKNPHWTKELVERGEFGAVISDHMFVSNYENGKWINPKVVPYENLSLNPATLALHYGQSVFEGMKAFKMQDGSVSIFRIEKHLDRFNKSLNRMCMPTIPADLFHAALLAFVKTDLNWVPEGEGHSLYIRPFVFASEARFGVKIADEYMFVIFAGPVGPYYGTPLKIKVETHFARATRGGAGFAKCAGNYGASFLPTRLAKEEGFDQILWTDGRENKYIEESGTMNVMFIINGQLITPSTSDSILDGITRDSILTLTNEMDMPVEIKKISVDDLEKALKANQVSEAFGTGTAAVVAPIESISINGHNYILPATDENAFMLRAKKKLMQIRTGVAADKFSWNTIVE